MAHTEDANSATSSWVYPDREAWQELLKIRPKPRPVMERPSWWRRPWPATWPGKPTAAALSIDRLYHAARSELAWARKCFRYAQAVLPQGPARRKARLLADALARTRSAMDRPAKASGLADLVHELAPVGRYDPRKYPHAFIEMAGRSVQGAGRLLASSPHPSVAYWGRVLVRAGGYFLATREGLSEVE
ncbi:MAG: hypothetical protein J7M21_03265 [Planctomycetes bacterium]|nr:hypothetical protein [Planctomycetota bacterium]